MDGAYAAGVAAAMIEDAAPRPAWSLAAATVASTMAFVDGTVVNVVLPVVQSALGGTAAQMQWVVEAYALFLASLVLLGGALGDRVGRRRVFLLGTAVFTAASAACGAAPTPTVLIVARAAQGVGAAMLVPGSLALISAAYPDESARGRAIGTWSAVSAITTAAGPVAGGWLVAHASWRWTFLLNLPLAAVTLALSRRVPESRDPSTQGRLDVFGGGLAVVGLGAIVLALIEAPTALSWPVVASLIAGGGLSLAAFVVVEARTTSPLVPLGLFRSRTFTGTNIVTLLLYGALGGGLFFLPFELIQVHRYAPAAAGAALLPLAILLAVLGRWSGGLAGRYGARLPLVVGPLAAAAGFALLALLDRGGGPNGSSYASTFFPGVAVLGLGLGLTVAPLTSTVMSAAPREHAGAASGINNAVARAAGLLAIAALGVVLTARFDQALAADPRVVALGPDARALFDAQRARLAGADLGAFDPSVRAGLREALDEAYDGAFRTVALVCAGLAALGAVLAAALVEPKAPTDPSPERRSSGRGSPRGSGGR